MKALLKDMAAALFFGMILPGILLNVSVEIHERRQETGMVQESARTVVQPVYQPMQLRLGANLTQMDLDTYLVGVVLAEMPAFFETEALKAQAVAARTYTRKAAVTGGKHGDGSVCTDPGCCQAYITEEAYFSRGGTPEGLQRVAEAVAATSGQTLTYGGELIEATYFSCSGGSTEDAVAVWGAEFPYLQAVPSPGEEEKAPWLHTVRFTAEQFQTKLGVQLPGQPCQWFGVPTYTEGGGVEQISIGSEIYTGTQLRSLLNLRSTAFTLTASEDAVIITTRGYGHRVGMSQYGADAMAAAGKTYAQILSHYYPGTELTRFSP
ncbi:MAG: stage II sporulation protein D [Oscillospiraceae bacterium]|nr:stage II sporulation protein D [Oscillospiraceae bacterium]